MGEQSPLTSPFLSRREGVTETPEESSTWDLTKGYMRTYNTVGAGLRKADEVLTPFDPTFKVTEDMLNGYDPEHYDDLVQTRSQEHFDTVARHIQEDLDFERDMSEAGVGTNIGLGLVAMGLDPTTYLLGGFGKAAFQGSRIVRAAKVGAMAGATNAGQEMMMESLGHTESLYDPVLAGVSGMVLGGGAGYLFPDKISLDVDSVVPGREALPMGGDVDVQRASRDMVQAVREEAADVDTPKYSREFIERGEDGTFSSNDWLNAEASLWDKANARYRKGWDKTVSQAKTVGARLWDNPNGMVAKIGRLLAENSAGKGPRWNSAEMVKEVVERRLLNRFVPTYHDAYKGFARERGFGWGSRAFFGSGKREFDELVARQMNALAEGLPSVTDNKWVMQVVENQKKFNADALEAMRRAGVEGAERIADNPYYMPRKWNPRAMLHYGESRVQAVIKQGLLSGDVEFSEELAERISKAITRRFINRAVDAESNVNSLFSRGNKNLLKDVLADGGLNDKEIKDVFSMLFEERGEKTAQQVRHKLPINMAAEVDGLSVFDLVDLNFEKNIVQYARSTSGWVGLSEKGIRSRADWDELISIVRDRAIKEPEIAHQTAKGVDDLNWLFDDLIGSPHHEWTKWAKGARTLRDLTYMAKSGGMGFAQLPETAQILATGTVMNTIKGSPILRRLHSAVTKGKVSAADKSLLEDLAKAGYPVGDEHSWMRPHLRMEDDTLGMVGQSDSRFSRFMSNTISTGHRAAGYVSGQYHIQSAQQKLWARVLAQDLFQEATGKGSKIAANRLADMGLGGDKLERVLKQVKKFAKGEDYCDELGVARWTDEQARQDFLVALHRSTGQVIQKTTGAESYRWMASPTGKLFAQFKRFPLLAWEKQTMRQLKLARPDVQTAGLLVHTSLWAAGAYLGRTYLKEQGLSGSDLTKYRKERYSTQAIVAGTVGMMPTTGMLPDMFGAMSMFATGRNPMSYSGYGRSGVSRKIDVSMSTLGIPFGYAEDALKVGSAATKAVVTDYQMNRSDWKAAQRIAPLGNWPLMAPMWNAFIEDQPKRN